MNKTTTTTDQPAKVTGLVTCEHCQHALLHRYGNNPLLAQCTKKPQPYNNRFPYAVEIARAERICSMYTYTGEKRFVQQRQSAWVTTSDNRSIRYENRMG